MSTEIIDKIPTKIQALSYLANMSGKKIDSYICWQVSELYGMDYIDQWDHMECEGDKILRLWNSINKSAYISRTAIWAIWILKIYCRI